MNVLVTGASGFIGKEVVRVLSNQEDIQIFCLSRNIAVPSQIPKIKNVKYSLGEDLPSEIRNLKFDSVIHLAWKGLPNYSSDVHLMQIEEHVMLIKQLIALECKYFYLAGTCFEYMRPVGEISETHYLGAETKYGEAKIRLHEQLRKVADETEINLVWMRLFYLYGESQREGTLVGSLLKSIQKNEESFIVNCLATQLDYSEVTEIATKIVNLVNNPGFAGVLNIGSGKPTSISELVNRIKEDKQSKISFIEKDPLATKSFWANVTKYESYFSRP